MKKAFALVLLFIWAPVALGATTPLGPDTKVPGLKDNFARTLFRNSTTLLKALEKTFRNHVDTKTPLSSDETQCAVVRLAAGYVNDIILKAKGGLSATEAKGLQDALAYYKAMEEQFCRPPPGASTNRGNELVTLFVKRQSESASQAKVAQTYEASAEHLANNNGPAMTPAQVALAVAIGLAILAREAVPVIP